MLAPINYNCHIVVHDLSQGLYNALHCALNVDWLTQRKDSVACFYVAYMRINKMILYM